MADSSVAVSVENIDKCVWRAFLDNASGCYYYWNTLTDEVTWTMPDEYKSLVKRPSTAARSETITNSVQLISAYAPISSCIQSNRLDSVKSISSPDSIKLLSSYGSSDTAILVSDPRSKFDDSNNVSSSVKLISDYGSDNSLSEDEPNEQAISDSQQLVCRDPPTVSLSSVISQSASQPCTQTVALSSATVSHLPNQVAVSCNVAVAVVGHQSPQLCESASADTQPGHAGAVDNSGGVVLNNGHCVEPLLLAESSKHCTTSVGRVPTNTDSDTQSHSDSDTPVAHLLSDSSAVCSTNDTPYIAHICERVATESKADSSPDTNILDVTLAITSDHFIGCSQTTSLTTATFSDACSVSTSVNCNGCPMSPIKLSEAEKCDDADCDMDMSDPGEESHVAEHYRIDEYNPDEGLSEIKSDSQSNEHWDPADGSLESGRKRHKKRSSESRKRRRESRLLAGKSRAHTERHQDRAGSKCHPLVSRGAECEMSADTHSLRPQMSLESHCPGSSSVDTIDTSDDGFDIISAIENEIPPDYETHLLAADDGLKMVETNYPKSKLSQLAGNESSDVSGSQAQLKRSMRASKRRLNCHQSTQPKSVSSQTAVMGCMSQEEYMRQRTGQPREQKQLISTEYLSTDDDEEINNESSASRPPSCKPSADTERGGERRGLWSRGATSLSPSREAQRQRRVHEASRMLDTALCQGRQGRSGLGYTEGDTEGGIAACCESTDGRARFLDFRPATSVLQSQLVTDQQEHTDEAHTEVNRLLHTMSHKIDFLSAAERPVSAVSELRIQCEILQSTWQAGALCADYLRAWLTTQSEAILQLEEDTAPPGWSIEWNNQDKVYQYRNTETGDITREFPITQLSDNNRSPPHDEISVDSAHSERVRPERDSKGSADDYITRQLQSFYSEVGLDTEVNDTAVTSAATIGSADTPRLLTPTDDDTIRSRTGQVRSTKQVKSAILMNKDMPEMVKKWKDAQKLFNK